ncbi:leucine-rich repeat-containing protein egg-6-like [Uranotaenia lowii]|uniref:leucine-rich repeat-containing protein egg-6-like n=1 Tax=Uranotaenia lowii TaxID=190385 RepID=UPI00247A17BC|nr:leucine-rich repeat-containing protein egg-6-like [Uranotaenia lowii]
MWNDVVAKNLDAELSDVIFGDSPLIHISGGSIPEIFVPYEAQMLTLARSNTSKLTIREEGEFHLLSLLIAENPLENLSLQKLSKLEMLSLKETNLMWLDFALWDKMKNLNTLEIFKTLGKLIIKTSSQFSLPNLNRLQITFCFLDELSFSGWDVPSLALIDLSNNNLTQLPQDLNSLTSLQEVILESNFIEKLNISDFDGMKNLYKIVLFNNLITEITVLNSITLPELLKLDLQYNRLEDVSILQKINLPELQELLLTGNLLHQVPPFSDWPQLAAIDLLENPLDESWIRQEMVNPETKIAHLREIRSRYWKPVHISVVISKKRSDGEGEIDQETSERKFEH